MKIKVFKKPKKNYILAEVDNWLRSLGFKRAFPRKKLFLVTNSLYEKNGKLRIKLYVFSSYLCDEMLGWVDLGIDEYYEKGEKEIIKTIEAKFKGKKK